MKYLWVAVLASCHSALAVPVEERSTGPGYGDYGNYPTPAGGYGSYGTYDPGCDENCRKQKAGQAAHAAQLAKAAPAAPAAPVVVACDQGRPAPAVQAPPAPKPQECKDVDANQCCNTPAGVSPKCDACRHQGTIVCSPAQQQRFGVIQQQQQQAPPPLRFLAPADCHNVDANWCCNTHPGADARCDACRHQGAIVCSPAQQQKLVVIQQQTDCRNVDPGRCCNTRPGIDAKCDICRSQGVFTCSPIRQKLVVVAPVNCHDVDAGQCCKVAPGTSPKCDACRHQGAFTCPRPAPKPAPNPAAKPTSPMAAPTPTA